jgi:homoserine kinase type II
MDVGKTRDDSISRFLHEAARFFELGDIVAVEQLSAGVTNLTFLVQTERGEYILKEFLSGTGTEIKLEMVYLDCVQTYHLPAPEYLSSSTGEKIFHQGDRYLVAQEKMEGQIPELSVDVCREIGHQLGKLHQIPTEELPPKPHWLNGDYLPTKLAELKGQSFKYVTKALEKYEQLKDINFDSFPQVLIHGDITRDNLLFKGEELQAILDWEQTGVGAAIMDLAASITGLGLLQREGQVKQEYYQALLTGYQSERKLQRVEKQNLVKVIQYMGLIESVCVLYKYGIETPNEGKMGRGDYYWYFGLDKLELPEIG